MTAQTAKQARDQLKIFDDKIAQITLYRTINKFIENKNVLMRPLKKVSWESDPQRTYSDSGNGQSWTEQNNVNTRRFAEDMLKKYNVTVLGEVLFRLDERDFYLPLNRGESTGSITNTFKKLGLHNIRKEVEALTKTDTEELGYDAICSLAETEMKKNSLDTLFTKKELYGQGAEQIGLALVNKWKLKK